MLKLFNVVYVITLVYACIIDFNGMIVVSAVLPFVIPLIFRLLKIYMTLEVRIINIIFIYFSSLIGSCLGGYSLPLFDKVIHFISGIIVLEIGYMIYKYYYKNINLYMILFLNAFNMLVAFLWEVYEYVLLYFDYDAIRHYSTGVHDVMTDMIVCFLGGVWLSIYLYKSQHNIFVKIQEDLFIENGF